MAGIGKFKLADAVAPPDGQGRSGSTRKPTTAQQREKDASRKAKQMGTSTRGRMVEIGRGTHQAGRQGSS